MATLNPLIATLLTMAGERNTITIPRAFVRFTGSLEAAMLLNQLLYWTPRATRVGDAIYKTDRDWQEELCLSRYSVRKARERLETMGFLATRVQRAHGAPTVHYQLDYEELVRCWSEWLHADDRLSENEQSDRLISDNRSYENEQSIDRLDSDNEIVRNQTNMNKDYSETPTKTPPPPPVPPTAQNGGGGGNLNGTKGPASEQKPNRTELYQWLRANGIDSPVAAARNQHHDLAATQALYQRMVGEATGDERRKRIGRFIKALDTDGPPPIPAQPAAVIAPPPRERPPETTPEMWRDALKQVGRL